MSLVQGILLGMVQGLTEFLPVSSSGHLVLVQQMIEFDGPVLAIDSLLHVGTLFAVLVYFRTDISQLARSIWRFLSLGERDDYTSVARYIAVASIPAAVAGAVFEAFFSSAFNSTATVGVMLLITGLILWIAEGQQAGTRTLSGMTFSDSMWVGLAQMAAIMPGISRSGATIAAGMVRGVAREDAARFSFLLSVPIIAGGAAFEVLRTGFGQIDLTLAIAGMITAAFSGFLAISLLMKVVRQEKLRFFAVYCFIVGSVAITVSLVR